ncbi:LOW QUALITY PROTEIN: hypothetical protein HMPREF0005_05993, partial [Achromobacter xylosoxidans C54]
PFWCRPGSAACKRWARASWCATRALPSRSRCSRTPWKSALPAARAGCCARGSGPASTRTPSGRTRPRTPRRSRGSTACWPRAIGGWPIWWTNWRATGAAFCVAIPRWPGCGYRARFPWPTPTPACGCSRRRCRCGSSASRRIGSPWRRGRRAARPSLQI